MGKSRNTTTVLLTDAAIKQAKQESFHRVCEPRVNKAVKSIGLVGLCASQNYIYSEAEAKAVILALRTAVDGVAARFSGDTESVSGFKLPK